MHNKSQLLNLKTYLLRELVNIKKKLQHIKKKDYD